MSEVPVAEQPSVPPVLVQMHESTIFMVDQVDGLRACTTKSSRNMLAKIALRPTTDARHPNPPSAFAVDTSSKSRTSTRVAVGFQDGSFSLYQLETDTDTPSTLR